MNGFQFLILFNLAVLSSSQDVCNYNTKIISPHKHGRIVLDDVSPQCQKEIEKSSDQLDKCFYETQDQARTQLQGLNFTQEKEILAIMCPSVRTIQNCYTAANNNVNTNNCVNTIFTRKYR